MAAIFSYRLKRLLRESCSEPSFTRVVPRYGRRRGVKKMAEDAFDVNPVDAGGDSSTPTIESGEPGSKSTEPTLPAGQGEPAEAGQPDSQEPGKETRSSKRIRQLIKERDDARAEVDKFGGANPPRAPQPLQSTPEGEQVSRQLKDLGFVHQDELDKQQSRQKLNSEYDRLEAELDGEDGRPKFDRTVVQDHSIREGIFNPRAAYNDLFEDELVEWHKKQALSSKPTTPYSEKPAPPGGRKPPLSREDIAKLSSEEYERRRPEIMEALKTQALE